MITIIHEGAQATRFLCDGCAKKIKDEQSKGKD